MSRTLPIITLPNAKLRQKSKAIASITPEVEKLANAMKESTLKWEASREHEVGVALAAIQVAELKRVIIVREDFESRSNTNFNVYINPVITKRFGKIVEDYEGCLSVKDLYGLVPRFNQVEFTALTLEGTKIKQTAEGLLARIIQHEVDHTNGILFIDTIKDKDAFFELQDDGSLGKLDHETVLASSVLW